MKLENKTDNSCPYCGAEAKTGMIANSFWKCGNATTHENRRSELCRESEAHNNTKREHDMLRTALKEISNLCQATCLSFEEQCFGATKIASSALAQLKDGGK